MAAQVRVLMEREGIDVALLQEPYTYAGGIRGYGGYRVVSATEGPWSAVVVRDTTMTVTKLGGLTTPHVSVAEVCKGREQLYLVSVYCQFRDPIDEYLRQIENILMRLAGKNVIVAMDANAKSHMWHAGTTDVEGAKLEDFIMQRGLTVHNREHEPSTYWTTHGESNIDVTLSTRGVGRRTKNWSVKRDWTTSDHGVISFEIVHGEIVQEQQKNKLRYCLSRADWDIFSLNAERFNFGSRVQVNEGSQVEKLTNEIHKDIEKLCESSLSRRVRRGRSLPWWTRQLDRLRHGVARARREYQRSRGRGNPEVERRHRENYRTARNNYTKLIRRTKTEHWQNLVREEGRNNPFGFVYRCVAEKLRMDGAQVSVRLSGGGESLDWEQSMKRILEVLVPDDEREGEDEDQCKIREDNQRYWENVNIGRPDPVTASEIEDAVAKMKNGKAPGEDLLEVEVLRRLWGIKPEVIVRLFNECLKYGRFPFSWKVGVLRLLLKTPEKDPMNPKSYRPICLLSHMGKLYERVLVKRLKAWYEGTGAESSSQYGFKEGLGTVDAVSRVTDFTRRGDKYVAAVFVDISGAFDNMWWPAVLARLRRLGCPGCLCAAVAAYFTGRRVKVTSGDKVVEKEVTKGCPQGSISGPFLWNLLLDEVLEDEMGRGDGRLKVAYADDVVILVTASSRREVEEGLQGQLDHLQGWLRRNKLQISREKTTGIVLKGKLSEARPPTVKVEGSNIKWKTEVKYLGVVLDRDLGFVPHMRYIRDKVTKLAGKFHRIAREDWGWRQRQMLALYRSVCLGMMSYAVPVWVTRVGTVHCQRILESAQRPFLLMATRACRTVSNAALQVLAGVLPADLEMQLAAGKYRLRRGEAFTCLGISFERLEDGGLRRAAENIQALREHLVGEWKRRWNASAKGRCVFSFIKEADYITRNPWYELSATAVMFVTGHGSFNSKLSQLGLKDDERCVCGAPETAWHILVECLLYAEDRERFSELYTEVGSLRTLSTLGDIEIFNGLAKTLMQRRRTMEGGWQ